MEQVPPAPYLAFGMSESHPAVRQPLQHTGCFTRNHVTMSHDGVHLLAGREKGRGDPQLTLLLAPVRFLIQRTSLRLTHGTWRPREGWALPEDTEPTPLRPIRGTCSQSRDWPWPG